MGFFVDAACLPPCRSVVCPGLWEPQARSAATTERGSSEGWCRSQGWCYSAWAAQQNEEGLAL